MIVLSFFCDGSVLNVFLWVIVIDVVCILWLMVVLLIMLLWYKVEFSEVVRKIFLVLVVLWIGIFRVGMK